MKNDCTTPTSVAYKCRFCERTGVAQYDAACDKIRLEHWLPLLACNRCADYHSRRTSFMESVWRTCYSLSVVLGGTTDTTVRTEANSQARKKLNDKSRAFAKHVCDYFRLTLVWEPDFTQMLLDRPEKARMILVDYESNISKLAKAA